VTRGTLTSGQPSINKNLTVDPFVAGNDMLISDLDSTTAANDPKIAYNSTDQEFLVIWMEAASSGDKPQLYGQRVDATDGSLIGADFLAAITPLFHAGQTTNQYADALYPEIAYNSTRNEYLVVFITNPATETSATEYEVFGQRLAADGTRLGGDPAFRVSTMGDPDDRNDADVAAGGGFYGTDVVYNATDDEYLVVWTADHVGVDGIVNGEFDIWGQRLNYTAGDAIQMTGGQIQISKTGTGNGSDTDGLDAYHPAVAWNSTENEYFVVWRADDAPGGNGNFQIYGQRLSNAGAAIGSDDFAISSNPRSDGRTGLADVHGR
jgi:hypothetical protein